MSNTNIPPEKEFTVQFSRPPLLKDRRGARRYRCGPAMLVLLHETETNLKTDAWAWDLSETGIGLTLPYPVDPGAAIILRLRCRPPCGTVTVAARVTHATPRDDGTWRIGCAFDKRLDANRLEEML
jgi:hypothetical protein